MEDLCEQDGENRSNEGETVYISFCKRNRLTVYQIKNKEKKEEES